MKHKNSPHGCFNRFKGFCSRNFFLFFGVFSFCLFLCSRCRQPCLKPPSPNQDNILVNSTKTTVMILIKPKNNIIKDGTKSTRRLFVFFGFFGFFLGFFFGFFWFRSLSVITLLLVFAHRQQMAEVMHIYIYIYAATKCHKHYYT